MLKPKCNIGADDGEREKFREKLKICEQKVFASILAPPYIQINILEDVEFKSLIDGLYFLSLYAVIFIQYQQK